MTFENNNRIADICTNSYGEFVAHIGYKNDDRLCGMDVVNRKTYKRQSTAIKFCENWING